MSVKRVIKYLFSNILIRNLILLLFTVIVLIYGLLFWLRSYTLHNQAVEVPDLKGLQEESAASLLRQRDLRYQIIDSVYTKQVSPGAVIEQVPDALSKVKKSRIVFLTVNAKSEQKVELPDLIDMSQRQAMAMLNSLGFQIDSTQYVHYEYKDLVVGVLYNGSLISRGAHIPYGSRLRLQVGDGVVEPVEVDSTMMDESDKEWFE